MEVAIRVRARLFARLREQADHAEHVDLDLRAAATVAGVYAELRRRYPRLEPNPSLIRAARNRAFCEWDDSVADGDEVAFIPPVSGGSSTGVAFVELTRDPLDARRLEAAVARSGAGAICTFTGVVRDNARDREVSHLEYEAYPEMAEERIRAIGAEILSRWPGTKVAIAHRIGKLEIGEASVVVTVSAPHRAEAFDACRWGIDTLKESVPIWKKEFATDGESWVEGDDLRRVDDSR
jgi:molybdopterin synthase catalytic subunit